MATWFGFIFTALLLTSAITTLSICYAEIKEEGDG